MRIWDIIFGTNDRPDPFHLPSAVKSSLFPQCLDIERSATWISMVLTGLSLLKLTCSVDYLDDAVDDDSYDDEVQGSPLG